MSEQRSEEFQIDATDDAGCRRLALRGAFSVRNASVFRERLRASLGPVRCDAVLDLSGVTYLDGGAISVLLEADRALRVSGHRLRFERLKEASALLSFFDWEELATPSDERHRPKHSLPVQVGENAHYFLHEAKQLTAFAGDLVLCLLRAARRPHRFRWAEAFILLERAGFDALPIVILISTLLGLILAFLGAVQLERFGASAYMTNLVALAMVRELGPIMTAILVAGRSGSGFAAELGSMAVDDEVDALSTMGFEPVEFLSLPRVLAVAASMPILVIFSDLAGLVGGLFVAVTRVDLSVRQYVEQVRNVLVMADVYTSLGKATFFGLLAAAVGCYKGLSVRGGAVEVGTAATSAVVTGIFLVIAADGLFAIVSTYMP